MIIIIIVVVRANDLSNQKHFFLHRLKVYWLFLHLLLFLVIKLLLWNQCSVLIKSIYYRETRLLFIFRVCHLRLSCLQQFDTWCLCSLRNFQKLCISMNITSQNLLNVSRNNDEYKIIEKKRWIKLSCYCIKFIAEFMKIFSLYVDRSWKIFEKKMRKKYKNQNIEQMINFRLFLKKFKNKIKKHNQMRIYSRQFKSISIKLIKWE